MMQAWMHNVPQAIVLAEAELKSKVTHLPADIT